MHMKQWLQLKFSLILKISHRNIKKMGSNYTLFASIKYVKQPHKAKEEATKFTSYLILKLFWPKYMSPVLHLCHRHKCSRMCLYSMIILKLKNAILNGFWSLFVPRPQLEFASQKLSQHTSMINKKKEKRKGNKKQSDRLAQNFQRNSEYRTWAW